MRYVEMMGEEETRKRTSLSFFFTKPSTMSKRRGGKKVNLRPSFLRHSKRERERREKKFVPLFSRHAAANPATAAPCRRRLCRHHDAAGPLAGGDASARERAAGSRGNISIVVVDVDRGVARFIVVARGFRGRRCGGGRPARQARLHRLQDTVRSVAQTHRERKKRREREDARGEKIKRPNAAIVRSLARSQAASLFFNPDLFSPSFFLQPTLQKKNSERVFDEIERLVAANPRTMRLDVIEAPPAPPPNKGGDNISTKNSSSSYSPSLRVVTVEPGGLSPGPPGSAAERESYAEKYRLLLNYGEHGRELVTVESALVLLRDLAVSEESERSSGGGGLLGARAAAAADADPLRSSLGGSERLRSLLKQAVFKIVPMENEAGRELVERGQLCERKNGRGVRFFSLSPFFLFSSSFFKKNTLTSLPYFFFFSFPSKTKKKTIGRPQPQLGSRLG